MGMDQENLEKVREFANTWKDYVPNFPRMENPSKVVTIEAGAASVYMV